MNLINDSIKTMGNPNKDEAPGSSKLPSSITLKDSFKDWWRSSSSLRKPLESATNLAEISSARLQNAQIEYDLFRAILSEDVYIIPPVDLQSDTKGSDKPIVGRFMDIDLPAENGKGKVFIHEFEISNKSNPALPERHVVFIHGYMAAMGYFVKNFEDLVKLYGNLVIHAIDMPGFGNSARPLFPNELIKLPKGASLADEINQIIAVENWFIDKFEAWRIAKNIDKFALVSHSMGAYLSCCYLLKYNKQKDQNIVDKFVLVSPLGTESSDISLINHKELQFNHHEAGGDPLQELFTNQDFTRFEDRHGDLAKLWEKLGKPKFPKNLLLRKMWEWNILPFQVLQCFGPMYSKIMSLWSFQRFKNLRSNDENKTGTNIDLVLKLHEYSFSIFNQYQGSGELAITKIINHEILPKVPLCDRGLLAFLTDHGIGTLWMYGDKDWMNMKGGEYCVEKLKALGNEKTSLVVVKDAGHHIYLDNPDEFNRLIIDFLDY